MDRIESFNSLQTGKHIESVCWLFCLVFNIMVSIPFKRESTSKAVVARRLVSISGESFNSLQTGKHIESKLMTFNELLQAVEGFNSLQTGKHIERTENTSVTLTAEKFQFPSNGKAHRKCRILEYNTAPGTQVSIPFKRESTSKVVDASDKGIIEHRVSIPFKRESTSKES